MPAFEAEVGMPYWIDLTTSDSRKSAHFYEQVLGWEISAESGEENPYQMARLQGLPIFITHGKLDWMFPVQTARQTQAALSAAGADVTYREIDDLSHTYPREINAELLAWLNGE